MAKSRKKKGGKGKDFGQKPPTDTKPIPQRKQLGGM